MTQQLENSWVKEIFNAEELKQYAQFEANLKSRFSEDEKRSFEKNWFKLMEEVNNNLPNDPTSERGIELGKLSMDIINGLYGKEYANLRATKWQKGFKEGKGLKEHGLTPEIVNWLDQALTAYWHQRISEVLRQAGNLPSSELLLLWDEVMDEMYGDDDMHKAEMLTMILRDDNLSQQARIWLKSIFKV